MQHTILAIIPMWAILFSFRLSADYAYVNIVSTNGKQHVLKQSYANTDVLYFSGLNFSGFSVFEH